MPIATIQTPDGRTAKIEVPQGATEAQILSFVKQQFDSRKNLPDVSEEAARKSLDGNFDPNTIRNKRMADEAASAVGSQPDISLTPIVLDTPEMKIAQQKMLMENPERFLNIAADSATKGSVRGIIDLGEGLKQFAMEQGEKLGVFEPGASEQYTKKVNETRKYFDDTYGQFGSAKAMRFVAHTAPYAYLPMAAPEALFARVLASSATTGAITGTQFVPNEKMEDRQLQRAKNTLTGIAVGGAFPLAGAAIGKVYSWAKEALYQPFTGQAGIEKDIASYLKKYIPENRGKIEKAIKDAIESGEDISVAQAIAKATAGTKDDFGGLLVKLESDLSKRSDVLKSLYKSQKADRQAFFDNIAASPDKLLSLEAARTIKTRPMYDAVKDDVIDPRSGTDKIAELAAKTQQRAAKKAESKIAALRDQGRFKALEQNQASRAVNNPPSQGPLLSQLRQRNGVPQSQFKGEGVTIQGETARIPARYTPQRQVENQAREAAIEAEKIAIQRSIEEQTLNDINHLLLKNTVGEKGSSLNSFLSRPSVTEAIQKARKTTLEDPNAYWPILPGQNFTVGNLQQIKKQLAGMLEVPPAQGGINKTTQRAIAKTLDEFTEWLGKKSSGFKAAEDAYQKASIPVNRAKVGIELQRKLVNSLDKEKPGVFAEAVDNPRTVIKAATGYNRAKSYTDAGLSQQEINKLQQIKKELAIEARRAEMKTGSASVLADISGEKTLVLPHILSRPIVITNAILKYLGQSRTVAYKEVLSDLMRDPKKFLEVYKMSNSTEKGSAAADIVMRLNAIIASDLANQETQGQP